MSEPHVTIDVRTEQGRDEAIALLGPVMAAYYYGRVIRVYAATGRVEIVE